MKVRVIVGLVLVVIVGVVVFLVTRPSGPSPEYVQACVTPSPVSIKGKVVVSGSLQPIPNAEINITNLTPVDNLCSENIYFDNLQIITDVNGHFESGAPARPIHKFNISIAAEGCTTYQASDWSFAVFTTSSEPTFTLDCQP